MLEAHLVSVKELVGPAIFLFDVAVGCEVAVFAIAHDWVSNRSEVGADLMGSSCKEFHFDEGEAHDGLEGLVFGYRGLAAFLKGANGYETGIRIFLKRFVDDALFVGCAHYYRKVFLLNVVSFFEKTGELA